MSTIAAVIGRILIGLLFIVSGASKLMNVAQTEGMITGVGLPSGLAVPTGIFEIVAGLCLAVGLMTRLASILLAGFTVLAVLFFHAQFATQQDITTLLMHGALIGGLLLIFAHSQLWYGWDRVRRDRRGEVAARDADLRVHDAELRAARAEGAAGALNADDATVVTRRPAKRRWF